MTYRGLITLLLVISSLSIGSACQSNHQGKALRNEKVTMVKLVCVQLCEEWADKPVPEREFNEQSSIDMYTKAIKNAKAMEGSLDYGAEFEMIIYYKDQSTQHFHLSLTESRGEQGLLVPLSNTEQGYRIAVKEADQLRDLIWSEIGE